MNILFVCKANVGRSQMAEAFFNALSKENLAYSAGTDVGEKTGRPIYNPETKSGEVVVKCMAELGYDLSKNKRKQLTPEMIEYADKIIALTEELPDYAKNSSKVIYWQVEDGKGKDYEFHCKIRDKIKSLVEEFSHGL